MKEWLYNAWQKFLALIVSRKFLAAIAATIVIVVNDDPAPGLDAASLEMLWKLWGVFIGAVAIEDGLRVP